ncbi:MAG: hypothetical protein ACK4HQ_08560 [Brevinematales bacterium]
MTSIDSNDNPKWESEVIDIYEKDGFKFTKTEYTFYDWNTLKDWRKDLMDKGFCHQLNVKKTGAKVWKVMWVGKKKI